jgi:regulatory protein
MPYVTAIKPQKNKKRVNIYLDGRFAFGIDLENLVKFKIKEGNFIEESEIEKIIGAAESQKIWDKLLRFSALRPRSEKEIEDWCKKKNVPKGLRKKYLDKLKHLDLANDLKFARFWVEQRLSFKPKPMSILKQELRQKGVKQETIDEVLSDFKIDELKQAKNLLEKNRSRWKRLTPDQFKKKASGFLLRKGYSWEIVKEALSLFDENDLSG